MVDTRIVQNAKKIQNVGWDRPDTGIPDQLQVAIDKKVSSGLSKVWQGILSVAASGFGKGVLLTAGILLAGAMIGNGATAFIDGVSVNTGVMQGVAKATSFLTSGFGIVTLLAGGALGSVSDTQRYQDRLTHDMAKQEAELLEKARNKGKYRPVSLEQAEGKTQANNVTIKQPTNGRAAKSVATALAGGGVELETNGWAARERERQAHREIVGKAF